MVRVVLMESAVLWEVNKSKAPFGNQSTSAAEGKTA